VALLPGVETALGDLRARGLRVGLASNCGRDYLSIAMHELGLERWVEEARCLASSGVQNKADMVTDLLLTFATRRAVMVGDRAADRDAAWTNGIPHIHLARGYATAGEVVEAEATIEGMDELLPRLDGRRRWIRAELEALALPARASVIGVGGDVGSGKTLFAQDLAALLREQGRRARVVALEEFVRREPQRLEDATEDTSTLNAYLNARYDLQGLVEGVLSKHRRDAAAAAAPPEVLLLEGDWLTHPRLFTTLDRLLWLEIPASLGLRRLAGRDARLAAPGALDEFRETREPMQRLLMRLYPPQARATRILDAGNALGLPPAG
jgi:uridine kinase